MHEPPGSRDRHRRRCTPVRHCGVKDRLVASAFDLRGRDAGSGCGDGAASSAVAHGAQTARDGGGTGRRADLERAALSQRYDHRPGGRSRPTPNMTVGRRFGGLLQRQRRGHYGRRCRQAGRRAAGFARRARQARVAGAQFPAMVRPAFTNIGEMRSCSRRDISISIWLPRRVERQRQRLLRCANRSRTAVTSASPKRYRRRGERGRCPRAGNMRGA